MELPAATKPTNANFVRVIRKDVQWIKVVTNDSIGTCSSELYSFSLLKLPPPPRAAICYCTKTSVSTAAIPLTFWYFFWVWYRYCLMSNTVRLCFGSVEVVQTSVSSEIAIFGCIAHTHTELREQCYRLALSQRAPYWCVGTASLLQGFRCLLLFQPWFSHRGHFSWSFWSGLGIQSIGLATTPVTARSWDMVGPLDEARLYADRHRHGQTAFFKQQQLENCYLCWWWGQVDVTRM